MTIKEKRAASKKLSIHYEKKHGSIAFLKLAMSSINKLLVQKKILTEEEMLDSILNQINSMDESL